MYDRYAHGMRKDIIMVIVMTNFLSSDNSIVKSCIFQWNKRTLMSCLKQPIKKWHWKPSSKECDKFNTQRLGIISLNGTCDTEH